MDTGRSTTFAGGLKMSPETAIDESGFFGTRRGFANIRWYEYAFFFLGLIAALVTDGLTIARLVNLGSLGEPEFAYGFLIIVHSLFLLLFLITGLLFQRISDIVAFLLSALLLTIYVVTHYFIREKSSHDDQIQEDIRLARLILTIVFNVGLLPLGFLVIKDYNRDEFSKRLFGFFPAARRPLKIYSTFDCVVRINTMLSISSLVLNLYNFTDSETIDTILLIMGVPLTLLWLSIGIGMARLENRFLVIVFYILSLFQLGFLTYTLYIGIVRDQNISKSSTTIIPISTTTEHSFTTEDSMTTENNTTTGYSSTTRAPIPNMLPVLQVLYVCVGANFLSHILSMIMGFWCTRNFHQGLRERVFNNKIDKWFQHRWSSN